MSDAIGRRIAIIHASPLVRKAMGDLLRPHATLHFTGGASRLGEVETVVREHRPDVLLLEYEQWRAQSWKYPLTWINDAGRVRIVMYGRSSDAQAAVDSIRCGAAGFVHDSCPLEHLVSAFLDALDGRSFLHLGENFTSLSSVTDEGRPLKASLTQREKQILELLLLRRSNEEIADQLSLTRQTVKNYVSRVFRKMGVSSRKELLRGEFKAA